RPDHHLLLEPGRVRILRGPRENGLRPAVDPLFRTAARSYGPRVVGIVLSGGLDDGTAGLLSIKRRGGIAVVQDPPGAPFPGMPRSAFEHVAVAHGPPARAIGPLLARLATEPARAAGPTPPLLGLEAAFAGERMPTIEEMNHLGEPTPLSCPECKGRLWRIQE